MIAFRLFFSSLLFFFNNEKWVALYVHKEKDSFTSGWAMPQEVKYRRRAGAALSAIFHHGRESPFLIPSSITMSHRMHTDTWFIDLHTPRIVRREAELRRGRCRMARKKIRNWSRCGWWWLGRFLKSDAICVHRIFIGTETFSRGMFRGKEKR